MKSNLRACVAFVAGSLLSGKRASSVYDYSRNGYINISGSVDRHSVQISTMTRVAISPAAETASNIPSTITATGAMSAWSSVQRI
jgi:hypothetical protein